MDPSTFLGGAYPPSIVPIDISFNHDVAVTGHFGSDQDLTNFGANAKALTDSKLDMESAAQCDAMWRRKANMESKTDQAHIDHAELKATGLADEDVDPAMLEDARMDPFAQCELGPVGGVFGNTISHKDTRTLSAPSVSAVTVKSATGKSASGSEAVTKQFGSCVSAAASVGSGPPSVPASSARGPPSVPACSARARGPPSLLASSAPGSAALKRQAEPSVVGAAGKRARTNKIDTIVPTIRTEFEAIMTSLPEGSLDMGKASAALTLWGKKGALLSQEKGRPGARSCRLREQAEQASDRPLRAVGIRREQRH